MIILPFLVAGPALFAGAITLGVLQQVSNAFSEVHRSFSLFIDNWPTITELRSIRKRLVEFQHNLDIHQPNLQEILKYRLERRKNILIFILFLALEAFGVNILL